MASFERLTTALLNTSEENTKDFNKLNIDFAIGKFDAPAEFQDLGKSLSNNRRNAAEDGQLHRVARKLGALLSSDIPDVPDLIQAYGKRVSEIAQMPDINPKGSTSHGAFADHAGVDGTTIWATATSGKKFITIHLLACMLARMWKHKQAVSIWSELVEQKKELLGQKALGEPFPISEAAASRIDISRSELAAWDASARAWLRTADEAKKAQQTQLRLILDNLHLTIPTASDLHSSVVTAWAEALLALDGLIKGQPLKLRSESVLLGLVSWHLYPDLLLQHPKERLITQADPLIFPGGVVTVGPESNVSKDDEGGIRWSLPLAHLKYYGGPQLSEGHTGLGSSPVTWNQFLCVALGSAISNWGFPPDDISAGLKLMVAIDEGSAEIDRPRRPSYMGVLASAARGLLLSEDLEKEHLHCLLFYGKKKCADFLAPVTQHPPSLFGLLHLQHILDCLPQYFERYKYQREVTDEPVSALREFVTTIFDRTALAGAVIEFGRPLQKYTHLIPEAQLERDDGPSQIPSVVWSWQTDGATLQYQSYPFSNIVDLPPGPGEDVKEFMFLCGVPKLGAVYLPSRRTRFGKVIPLRDSAVPICQVQKLLERGLVSKEWLARPLGKYCDSWSKRFPAYFRSLEALVDLDLIYPGLPGAGVNLHATSRSMLEAAWCKQLSAYRNQSSSIPAEIAFSCIAYFETGYVDIEPKTFRDAFAISCENTLYVSSILLQDLQEETSNVPLTRVIGNIGKHGLSVLVSPTNPTILQVTPDSWKVLTHKLFDGKARDNFTATSLHLFPTGYELTLDVGGREYRDRDAHIVEAAISLHDQGRWIADLDILKASKVWKRYRGHPDCNHTEQQRSGPLKIDSLITIDSWTEFLDPPLSSTIFRAQGNITVCLAAATLAEQKGYNAFIITPSSCWSCLAGYLAAQAHTGPTTENRDGLQQQSGDGNMMFIWTAAAPVAEGFSCNAKRRRSMLCVD